jgi:hypothetical protein
MPTLNGVLFVHGKASCMKKLRFHLEIFYPVPVPPKGVHLGTIKGEVALDTSKLKEKEK